MYDITNHMTAKFIDYCKKQTKQLNNIETMFQKKYSQLQQFNTHFKTVQFVSTTV